MAISLYLSGGSANNDPAVAIGGAKSSTAVGSRLFGPILNAQFTAGAVLYRCVYVLTDVNLNALKVWIASETPSANTTLAIAWGAAINATQTAIASETTAPSGVTFAAPASLAAATSGGNFTAGQYRALWVRYTITATTPITSENFSLQAGGDSVAAPAPAPSPSPSPAPAPSSALVPFGDHRLDSTEWGRIKGGGKILYDSLMNNAVGDGNNMIAHRFRATSSSGVTQVRIYWIATPTGGGYSAGNGGTIRIRVYPVDANNKPNLAAAHLSEGTLNPGLVGGDYPANGFVFYSPTTLSVVNPLVAGTLYCVVYENIHADRVNNWLCTDDTVIVSGNQPINPWLADAELAVLRGTGTAASATWTDETNVATMTTAFQQMPNVEITLANGTVIGQIRGEGANTNYATRGIQLTSSYQARSRIVAPAAWDVIGFSLSTCFDVAGDLLVELLTSGGTVLRSVTITQATANASTQTIIAGVETAAITTWYHRLFPSAVTLTSGSTYYLRYTPQGSCAVRFLDVRDFRDYGYANQDNTQNFHAEHKPSVSWIGFYSWGHSTDYDNSAWRDVIHLA